MTDLITPPNPSGMPLPPLVGDPPRATFDPLFDASRHGDVDLPPLVSRRRRALSDRRLMHYNRLAFAIAIANVIALVLGVRAGWFSSDGIALGALSNLVIVNLAAAILIRQQYVINLLFRAATAAPTSWPLRIRWTLGKVYHFGGIHVGGAVAGALWFTVFMVSIVYHSVRGLGGVSATLLTVSGLLLVLIGALIGFSLPRFRAKYHDRFEKVHRFGGWASLGLFWIQSLVFIADGGPTDSVSSAFVSSPAFWLLAVITVSIALPWTRLRRVPVDIERPSNHVALARFDYGVKPFAGSSTTISRSPLREWHSFANVPSPDEDGYRLTISRAGDWTGSFIDDRPTHVWVKGVPTAGVGNIDKLFKRVVWVATGSGIGPTLPHLLSQDVPAHLVWATRDPWETYGNDLVAEIQSVQPHATIWDTNALGKPDMVKLAHQAVQAFDAEAVICIANKSLTWQVVEGMERHGIPAYGAIWDS